MTIYRAVVKYERDARPGVKRAALLDGLREIAAELHDEHGMGRDDIAVEFESAVDEGVDS